jgi:hypothetical protein
LLPPCSGSAPENSRKGKFKKQCCGAGDRRDVIKLPPEAGVVIMGYRSGSGSLLFSQRLRNFEEKAIKKYLYTQVKKDNFQGTGIQQN